MEHWSKRFDIEIELSPEAAEMLAEKAIERDQKLEDVFAETFKNYEHG